MNFSNELIEKAKTASSAEELLEMARAEWIELSAAEAETYFSFLSKDCQQLSDKELEQVAGGKGVTAKYHNGQHVQFWPPNEKSWLVGKIVTMYTGKDAWTYGVKLTIGTKAGLKLIKVPLEDPSYRTKVISW